MFFTRIELSYGASKSALRITIPVAGKATQRIEAVALPTAIEVAEVAGIERS